MVIDSSNGPVSFSADKLPNDQYHSEREHHSRSTVHQIYRYGGRGQWLLEQGRRLVGMNTGLKIGSWFDAYWEARALGRDVSELFVTPPEAVLASDGSKRGKAYTDWAKSQTGMIVTRDDIDLLQIMWDGVEKCESAVYYLHETSDCQRSVFWVDKAGHRRKARFDGQTSQLIYDVKTTSSPWDEVYKSFVSYGYLWQAAWYTDAAYQIGYEPFRMPFVVVQTVPPYECRVFVMPNEMVDAAREQIASTLDAIKLRKETGEYLPADYGVEQEMVFPAWVWKKEVYIDPAIAE